MNKILLIGCGHMGSALLRTWSFKTNYFFTVVDPLKYNKINKQFNKNVAAFKSLKDVKEVSNFNIIIFAVKPQVLNHVLKDFSQYKFRKKTVFVSIVAGKKISFFNKFLPKSNQFIRVMPNMPAMINEGMSCIFKNLNVTILNKKKIESLFSKIGKTIWLKNEKDINIVTAISGSGPGYVFLFIDAFEKAALDLGLGEKITKQLIYQTLLGSVHLLSLQKSSASELAEIIAIKGGTTEAGLKKFKNNKILHKIFEKVVNAAFDRANQLGR